MWPLVLLGLISVAPHRNQQTPPPLWLQMESATERFGYNGVSMEVAGHELLAKTRHQPNCDSLLMAEFLLRQASIMLNKPFDGSSIESAKDCPWEVSPLFRVAGVSAFLNGQFEEASVLFDRCQELAQSEAPWAYATALQNLGASLVQQHRYAEAYTTFVQAYHADSSWQTPVALNSLAYTSLVAGECIESMRWSEMAMKNLEIIAARGEVPIDQVYPEARFAALLNIIEAGIALGDTTAADQAFAAVDFHLPAQDYPWAAARVFTAYCQWKQSPNTFRSIRPLLMRWIASDTIGQGSTVLGANWKLFTENDWERSWEEVARVPWAFRGISIGHCGGDLNNGDVAANLPNAPDSPYAAWAWAVLAVLAGTGAVRGAVRWKRMKNVERWSPAALEAAVDLALSNNAPRRAAREQAAYAFQLLAKKHLGGTLEHLEEWSGWSELERKVALGLAQGEPSKALALRLNCSLTHIYKTRQALRESLQLAPQASLEHWLQKRLQ